MLRNLHLLSLFWLLALVTGCATSLTADVDPSADLSSLQTFYVANQPKDRRGLEVLISDKLNSMGKSATSGKSATPPDGVDAVVNYIDRWMWDITNYMIELTVEIRDPKTNYLIASGKTYRTSLARESPEAMVDEVLNKIFAK